MNVFYTDTIPPARENPHKIFPAVFAGFSPNDHTVKPNVFDARTNWLISENTAFFAVRQKRTVPLVILTKKILVSWTKRKSKGRPALYPDGMAFRGGLFAGMRPFEPAKPAT